MSDILRIRLWSPEKIEPMRPLDGRALVTDVPEPELHVFRPDEAKNTGLAAIVCPGGAYAGLSMYPEGHVCAAWLASIGITGLALQYRLPGGQGKAPLEDAGLALKFARERGAAWGIDPARVGFIGFSAGGHLAALASNPPLEGAARPAFSVLFYPVISLEDSPEGKTTLYLLGENAPARQLFAYSGNRLVTGDTPPALLLHCDDDALVPTGQSILYYNTLKEHGVPASLHIFPEGGHGWGFTDTALDGRPFRYGEAVRLLVADWLLSAV